MLGVCRGPVDSNHRPRWVNSGTVVGTIKDQRQVFEKLEELFETRVEEADQAYFNTLHYRGDLTVDYFSRLFLSTTATDETIMRIRHPLEGIEDSAIPYELSPVIFADKYTGEIPVVVHFANAFRKEFIDSWYGSPWWSSTWPEFASITQKKLDAGIIRFAHDRNLTKTWAEFCPKELTGKAEHRRISSTVADPSPGHPPDAEH